MAASTVVRGHNRAPRPEALLNHLWEPMYCMYVNCLCALSPRGKIVMSSLFGSPHSKRNEVVAPFRLAPAVNHERWTFNRAPRQGRGRSHPRNRPSITSAGGGPSAAATGACVACLHKGQCTWGKCTSLQNIMACACMMQGFFSTTSAPPGETGYIPCWVKQTKATQLWALKAVISSQQMSDPHLRLSQST